jgi:hypothetical protein
MWPFSKPEPPVGYAELAALVERHREETERRMKEISVEWEDMFDRFRRLYAKISKRAKDAEDAVSRTVEDPGDTEGRLPRDRAGNGQPDGFSPRPAMSTAHLANRLRSF